MLFVAECLQFLEEAGFPAGNFADGLHVLSSFPLEMDEGVYFKLLSTSPSYISKILCVEDQLVSTTSQDVDYRKHCLEQLGLREDWSNHLARSDYLLYSSLLDTLLEQATHHPVTHPWRVVDRSLSEHWVFQQPVFHDASFYGVEGCKLAEDSYGTIVRIPNITVLDSLLSVLREVYGEEIEFHGTSVDNAADIRRTLLHPGNRRNEFSMERAIYTTVDPLAAIGRVRDKYLHERVAALILFQPRWKREEEREMVLIYDFEDNPPTRESKRLTRQWVHANWTTHDYSAFLPDLLYAEVIGGRICVNPSQNRPESIRFFQSSQLVYLTEGSMKYLNDRWINVVLECPVDTGVSKEDRSF